MDNFEYYLLERKGDQTYPLIRIADNHSEIMQLEISEPKHRKPVLADYLRGSEDFLKKHIVEAMQALNMERVKFRSTELDDGKGNIIDDYVCIIADDNCYKALDKEKSDFKYNEERNRYRIKKVVLDRKVLSEIPLNQRLGFCLREASGYRLYHKSVIDVIQSFDPTGVYYVNIEDYVI